MWICPKKSIIICFYSPANWWREADLQLGSASRLFWALTDLTKLWLRPLRGTLKGSSVPQQYYCSYYPSPLQVMITSALWAFEVEAASLSVELDISRERRRWRRWRRWRKWRRRAPRADCRDSHIFQLSQWEVTASSLISVYCDTNDTSKHL